MSCLHLRIVALPDWESDLPEQMLAAYLKAIRPTDFATLTFAVSAASGAFEIYESRIVAALAAHGIDPSAGYPDLELTEYLDDRALDTLLRGADLFWCVDERSKPRGAGSSPVLLEALDADRLKREVQGGRAQALKALVTLSAARCEQKTVLDLSAGAGFWSRAIAPTAEGVVGYELGPEAMGDVTLPFPTDAFDVVVAFDVLERLPWGAVDPVFDEIKRVLRADGIVLINASCRALRQDPAPYEQAGWVRSAEFRALLESHFEGVEAFSQLGVLEAAGLEPEAELVSGFDDRRKHFVALCRSPREASRPLTLLGRPDPLRILAFNWHEPYLALLARTGHHFDVGDWMTKADGTQAWDERKRPVPRNVTLVRDPEVIRRNLHAGDYDLVLCQTPHDLAFVRSFSMPMVYLAHTAWHSDYSHDPQAGLREREQLRRDLEARGAIFVAISEMKYGSWQIAGRVIPPGLDVRDYPVGGHRSQDVLTVGNLLRERPSFDLSFVSALVEGIASYRILGFNPTVPGSVVAPSWQSLLDSFAEARVYLHATVWPYEDGYNLALLEAMASACPVLALASPNVPVENGVNGYQGDDPIALRSKLHALLLDQEAALQMGRAARETVRTRFALMPFLSRWNETFADALSVYASRSAEASEPKGVRSVMTRAADPQESNAELPSYYQNERPELVSLVPKSAARVLDVGCGAGAMGRAIKRQGAQEVVGLELNPQAARVARAHLDAVLEVDLNHLPVLPFSAGYFDCIVFADVLEHLLDPLEVLRHFRRYLSDEGVIVCSIPNVRHQSVWLQLLVNGRWEYQQEGILDRTHLRFFTLTEIRILLKDAGFDVGEIRATSSPPVAALEPLIQAVGDLGGDVDDLRRDAQIMQFIFSAKPSAALGPVAPSPPRVSIIVPVFNKVDYTVQCLEALIENTGEALSYEVVIVDNASSDGTAEFLDSLEGDVRVIRNPQNMGFARACNQGAGVAKGQYLVFLNNDTLPQPGWLDALLAEAEPEPQIGVVGCKLLYPDTGRVQHAGMGWINGLPDHPFRHAEPTAPEVNQARDLDMVTGACMLVKRDLFHALGGFDEGYLNGVEDIDFCLQVRRAGYRVRYTPKSVLYHYEGTSEGRFDHVTGNLQRFFARWRGSFDSNGDFVPSKPPLPVRWEGSQFIHHSLALVNRELCQELIASGAVDLEVIPYEPHSFEPDSPGHRSIAQRIDRHLERPAAVHIRHQWPPKFTPPSEGAWVMIQPWEYGSIPEEWVEPMTAQVDEIWVPSSYVREAYIRSGIPADKVWVVPNGVDAVRFTPETLPYPLKTGKGFKFLFVGGTLVRKGIDLLLEVYGRTFTKDDDVCLVIKDMGGGTFY